MLSFCNSIISKPTHNAETIRRRSNAGIYIVQFSSFYAYVCMKVSMRQRMPRTQVTPVSTQQQIGHPRLTSVRPLTTSIPHTRPVTTQPRFTARNRRYAAVLSRLSNQTTPYVQSSSSAFSGYVPKCRQDLDLDCNGTVVKSVSCATTEQRKTKVSFCLQPSQAETHEEHRISAGSSKSAVKPPSSSAASITTVTCSETVMSTTASLLPQSTDGSGSFSQVSADSGDVSLLCAELFVDSNASFCDELLQSLPGSCEQQQPHVLPDSSSGLKQDTAEPVSNFTFDDFVEFDDFLSCN